MTNYKVDKSINVPGMSTAGYSVLKQVDPDNPTCWVTVGPQYKTRHQAEAHMVRLIRWTPRDIRRRLIWPT